ncbi:MAG: tributyrin esterase [Planctomycetota bacterium]
MKQESPDQVLDISKLSDEDLRESIMHYEAGRPSDEDGDAPLVQLVGLQRQHSSCMRLSAPEAIPGLRIHAKGSLGDYAFAWTRDLDVYLDGSVGHGFAEGMQGGVVKLTGSAGCGVGAGMQGGTLAVYGSVGDRCGAAMRGGSIFVRGDAGDDVGAGALDGTVVIGGDAGRNLGDALNNVTVFLRGKAASLAPGVIEAPLRKKEEVKLGLLLMSASIRGSATDFRRVIPSARLQAEVGGLGEWRPNGR